MTFHVGQKVVCVDDAERVGLHWNADRPVSGNIYTVVSTFIHRGELLLTLSEIKNNSFWNGGYRSCRFRHVVERKTDISIFKRILERPDMEIVS